MTERKKRSKKLLIHNRMVCGSKRAYPMNVLAFHFLDLICVRPVKTFTHDQVWILKKIADMLDFIVVEVNED